MFKKYRGIPEALQREVIYRFGYALIAVIVFAALILWTRDLYTIIPGVAITAFILWNAYSLLLKAAKGDYVVVSGVCSEVATTTIRRRTKSIILRTDEHLVQVMLKQRISICKGASVDLYVDKKTTVEERNGMQRLHSYLLLDQKGRSAE